MKRRFHILVVDDNPADAHLLREMLESDGVNGRSVGTAGDGEQALDTIRRTGAYAGSPRPDLVVLDLNLPRMDGREVLAEIRADPQICAIPVIVASSSEERADVARCYQLGANAFISKPTDLRAWERAGQAILAFWFGIANLPSG